MFNNPFDSFHNTVAEAKEEREQLDRLLTISTPWERLLVAIIALLLSVLLAWLFLGNVARSLALDGVLAEPRADRSVQVLVWVESDDALRIEAGMPVTIELAMADGDRRRLGGEVAAVAAVPLPEGTAAFDAAPPVSAQRLEISLDENPDPDFLAGRECRIVIELGRQAPAALFGSRRS